VTVLISGINDPAVAFPGTLTAQEDTAASGTLVATDVENDSLVYSIVNNGTKGTVVITNNATGTYTYTPTTNEEGTDTFTFRAFDGTDYSNIATITVSLQSENDSPSSDTQSVTTLEDTVRIIVLSGTDPENDPLSFEVLDHPIMGL